MALTAIAGAPNAAMAVAQRNTANHFDINEYPCSRSLWLHYIREYIECVSALI